MIGLAAQTYDIDGARIFRDTDRFKDQANRKGGRRVSRTATLDGGVSISDMGYSDGDRTLAVVVPGASEELIAFAEYLIRTYALITITTGDGAYEAAPETHNVSDGTLTLTLLIAEKISE